MKISVGSRVFRIERAKRARLRIKLSALAIIASVAMIAAMKNMPQRNPADALDTAKSIPGKSVGIDPPTDSLLDEARGFLKEGSVSQAKLSLMAAREAAPSDERVQRLIAEISKDGIAHPSPEEGNDNRQTEEALALFKEAQTLEASDNYLGARKAFDRSLDILSRSKTTPPFAAALKEASERNLKLATEKIRPKLGSIKEMIESLPGMPAESAAKTIRSAHNEFFEIWRSMSKDKNVAELKTLFDSALKTVSSRWIAAAQTAERLKGCTAALPMYEAISKGIGDIEPPAIGDAKDGIARCKKSSQ